MEVFLRTTTNRKSEKSLVWFWVMKASGKKLTLYYKSLIFDLLTMYYFNLKNDIEQIYFIFSIEIFSVFS